MDKQERMIDADALIKKLKSEYDDMFGFHQEIFDNKFEYIKNDALKEISNAFKRCVIPKQKFYIGQEVIFYEELVSFRGRIELCEYYKIQNFISVWEEVGTWRYKVGGNPFWVYENRIRELATQKKGEQQ